MSNPLVIQYIEDSVAIPPYDSYLSHFLSRLVQYYGVRLEGFGGFYINLDLHINIVNLGEVSYNDINSILSLWSSEQTTKIYIIHIHEDALIPEYRDKFPFSEIFTNSVTLTLPNQAFKYEDYLQLINNMITKPFKKLEYSYVDMKQVILDNISEFVYTTHIPGFHTHDHKSNIELNILNENLTLFSDTYFEYSPYFNISESLSNITVWNNSLNKYEEYPLTTEELEFFKLKFL